MLQWILDILRGAVIGVSNIIPGVSGGTMAETTRVAAETREKTTRAETTRVAAETREITTRAETTRVAVETREIITRVETETRVLREIIPAQTKVEMGMIPPAVKTETELPLMVL